MNELRDQWYEKYKTEPGKVAGESTDEEDEPLITPEQARQLGFTKKANRKRKKKEDDKETAKVEKNCPIPVKEPEKDEEGKPVKKKSGPSGHGARGFRGRGSWGFRRTGRGGGGR